MEVRQQKGEEEEVGERERGESVKCPFFPSFGDVGIKELSASPLNMMYTAGDIPVLTKSLPATCVRIAQ